MKLKFEITIEGSQSLKTKFEHAVLINSKIGDLIVAAFSSNLMLAFDLRAEDKVKIHSFFGNIVDSDPQIEKDESNETLQENDKQEKTIEE